MLQPNDLQVERNSDDDHFRITAKPVGHDFAARFPNADGGKPTPTLPEPQQSPLLASGDQFNIDLVSIPGVAQSLSDTAQVRLNARGTPSTEASRAAAPLGFVGLKVQINGQVVSTNGPGATVAGRFIMFNISGHGGYFLSNEPVETPGFGKVGVVDRTHLRFTVDNETYDCDSQSAILRNSDPVRSGYFMMRPTNLPATGPPVIRAVCSETSSTSLLQTPCSGGYLNPPRRTP
jgi:hypothetical protein